MSEIAIKTTTNVENTDNKNNSDKKYNATFMNLIFDYINTRQVETQDILIFDTDLLESYIKKQFLEVYLPANHQLIWQQNKGARKDKTEFLDVNHEFMQQFAKENNLVVDKKSDFNKQLKGKTEKQAKKLVSDYIIQELVDRMALQYDKKDILEKCVGEFEQIVVPMKPGQTEQNTKKKEDYKCEIQYGKFLSHPEDELNKLKSSYVNMLKIILKNVNNQALKQLQELQQNCFKMVDV